MKTRGKVGLFWCGVYLLADAAFGTTIALARGSDLSWLSAFVPSSLCGYITGLFLLWVYLRPGGSLAAAIHQHPVLPGDVGPGMSTRRPVFNHPAAVLPLTVVLVLAGSAVFGLLNLPLLLASTAPAFAVALLPRALASFVAARESLALIRAAFRASAPPDGPRSAA